MTLNMIQKELLIQKRELLIQKRNILIQKGLLIKIQKELLLQKDMLIKIQNELLKKGLLIKRRLPNDLIKDRFIKSDFIKYDFIKNGLIKYGRILGLVKYSKPPLEMTRYTQYIQYTKIILMAKVDTDITKYSKYSKYSEYSKYSKYSKSGIELRDQITLIHRRTLYNSTGETKYLYLNEQGLYQISDSFELRSSGDVIKIKEELLLIYSQLNKINEKGFVNNLRLSSYPVFKDMAILYSLIPGKIADNFKTKFSNDESIKQAKIDWLEINLTNREKVFLSSWLYALFNLNIYFLISMVLDKIDKIDTISDLADLASDLNSLSKDVKDCINISVRDHLKQRGVTVIKNIYSGYDTEYKNIDMKSNKILSAQWASNCKILLKIPYLDSYKLTGMNTHTGFIYPINEMWHGHKKINTELLEKEIAKYINSIRKMKFYNNDIGVMKVVNGLINHGIPYIKKDGFVIFTFDRSVIRSYIKFDNLDTLKFNNILDIPANMVKGDLDIKYEYVMDLLKGILNDDNSNNNNNNNNNKDPNKIEYKIQENRIDFNHNNIKDISSLEEHRTEEHRAEYISTLEEHRTEDGTNKVNKRKKLERTKMKLFSPDEISVTTVNNFYLIGHLTQADLCFLSDFESIKEDLDIVGSSFVTRGKGLNINGYNVHLRDTMLLAPPGSKSLGSIGFMYGDKYKKIVLGLNEIENMDKLLINDRVKFIDYAIKDSLISLIHASYMEDYNFKTGQISIPLTLSSLSSNYLRYYWKNNNYKGYQVSNEYLLSDMSKSSTPKGLSVTKNIGIKMPLYIANYKGGRNESFMYGVDKDTKWYDYDLISAYTTAMTLLGNPNYERARILRPEDIAAMGWKKLVYSYTIIKGTFSFPSCVKYPSIPVYANDGSTVYPLGGSCVLTGIEYVVAINQGCNIIIEEAYQIPFESKKDEKGKIINNNDGYEENINHPFKNFITDIQRKRSNYQKGTINNLMYKLIGNSVYGLTVKGINNKMKYDIKLKRTIRMDSNDISNPIIASWITAFIRSLLGELLDVIDILQGKVVSVTTDGFITNIEDLELKILNWQKTAKRDSLLKEYRRIRREISVDKDPTALEIKHEGLGITSWTVRGQFSKDSGIKAMTGFQVGNLTPPELEYMLLKTLRGPEKTIDYVQTSLRSAKDIFLKNGHVTEKLRDQIFTLNYDNRRLMLDEDKDLKTSKPLNDVSESQFLRHISALGKNKKIYQRSTSSRATSGYKSRLEVIVRRFIVGLINNSYNLDISQFKNYEDVANFIKGFEKSTNLKLKTKIDRNYIADVKRRCQKISTKVKRVNKTTEGEIFINFVINKYKFFKAAEFWTNKF